MNQLLLILVFGMSFEIHAQWGEDPFVYDEVPSKTLIKNSGRAPASVVSKEKIKPNRSVSKSKSVQSEKKKPVRILNPNIVEQVNTDPNWEMIKGKFKGNVNPELRKVSSEELRVSKPKKPVQFQSGIHFSYINLDADSNYYPKKYSADALSLGISAALNFSETSSGFFSYETSFGLSGQDKTDGSSDTEIDHSWLELGYEWGSNLGDKGGKLRYQLGYREWHIKYPKSSTNKLGHKVTSAFIGAKFYIPTGDKSEFGVRMNFFPAGSHSEEKTSWTNVSGDSPKVYGGEIELSYTYQIQNMNHLKFFVESYLENTKFKSSSATVDPVSGQIIDRVNVRYTNQKIGFELLWTY